MYKQIGSLLICYIKLKEKLCFSFKINKQKKNIFLEQPSLQQLTTIPPSTRWLIILVPAFRSEIRIFHPTPTISTDNSSQGSDFYLAWVLHSTSPPIPTHCILKMLRYISKSAVIFTNPSSTSSLTRNMRTHL